MRNPVFRDKALYHKATALCIANHCYESTVVPCTTHVFEARELLAVAATPSVGAARLLTEGVAGAADVERPPACDGGSTSAMNNPQEGQLLGAESGPVRPQKQSMA